jgi:hypothetical protein
MVCGDLGTCLVEACVGDVEHMVSDMSLGDLGMSCMQMRMDLVSWMRQ